MSFSQWLRANSEHYLLQDAQARMARKTGLNPPINPRGLVERFWRQVFVPLYRLLPSAFRDAAMRSLPGSHRKVWPRREKRQP